jgi:site-specific recombinase XerD
MTSPKTTPTLSKSRTNHSATTSEQSQLLTEWEEASLTYIKAQSLEPTQARLPQDLPLASAVGLFLATLKGQSDQTLKTYRVGCRRFMWFIFSTERGEPTQVTVSSLSPLVLEEFYLWLVDNYGRKARATTGSYLAASRNLFDYLARHRLTPQNCQYQEMVAGLSKLAGRASYKTPRIRGKQVEEVARLALSQHNNQALAPAPEPPSDLLGQPLALAGGIVVNPASPNEPVVKAAAAPVVAEAEAEPDFENETQGVGLTTAPRPRKVKNTAELERRQLEELRDRAIILTLYTTGMRRQEVASLNRDELENLIQQYQLLLCKVDEGKAHNKKEEEKKPAQAQEQAQRQNEQAILFELIITGKGQKERLVYFDATTLAALGEYLTLRGKDGYRPLFLQHHRGRDKVKPGPNGERYRISLVTLWQVVSRYAKRLGVEIHPHDFRHNLATTLLNAGAQLSEVQDILGHASPTTTKQIYAHYDKGHLKEAFGRYRKSAEKLGG